jgi:hypothetical protein
MSKLIKQEHGGKINQFEKGESGNPKGRAKKMVTVLKESGYKLSEINDTIQAMMAMTIDELGQVLKTKDATILELTIAAALLKGFKNGSFFAMDTVITRFAGKPRETAEISVKTDYNITLNLGK